MPNFAYDYQWVLTQPSLMQLPENLDGVNWLNHIIGQISPPPSEESLDAASHRLGHYYEALVAQHLLSSEYIIDIKRNTQLIVDGVTKGEFDFLGRATGPQGKYHFHLECAVKFYLLDGDPLSLDDYVGTNRKDTLGKKWRRMLNQQSQLSVTDDGKKLCEQFGFTRPKRLILVQGMVFLPLDKPYPKQLSSEINQRCVSGWWVTFAKLSLLMTTESDRYFQILVKPNWLSGDFPEKPNELSAPASQSQFSSTDYFDPKQQKNDHRSLFNYEQLLNLLESHFAESNRAVHLRVLIKDEVGELKELNRGFVVADTWSEK